jgi:hypothetical protein
MKKYQVVYLLFFTFIACNHNAIKKNKFGGITKTLLDAHSHPILDSVFDSFGAYREVIDYYRNTDKIKKITVFKAGLTDGFSTEFYINGNAKSKRFNFLGKECFERVEYYEDGRPSQYIFLSSDQTDLYIRLYDSLGQCIGIRGTPFFESFILGNQKLLFSTADTVSATFYAPNPPDCRVALYTIIEGKEIENISKIKKDFFYKMRIYPLKKGDFEWEVRMKVFDKITGALMYTSEIISIKYQVI